MEKIDKNSIVTLDYNVTDPDGEVIDAGKEQLVYLHGGYDDIFVSIEEALQGKSVGASVMVKMQPAQAFGEYDPELVNLEPVDTLPQPLTVGMQIEGTVEGESENTVLYRVTDIADGKAVLDGNHPLAGMALVFNCTVTSMRPASPDEIAAGHALHQV